MSLDFLRIIKDFLKNILLSCLRTHVLARKKWRDKGRGKKALPDGVWSIPFPPFLYPVRI